MIYKSLLGVLTVFAFASAAIAQESQKGKAHIKMAKVVNGETVMIDTVIEMGPGQSVEDLMENFGGLKGAGDMDVFVRSCDKSKVKCDKSGKGGFLGVYLKGNQDANGQAVGVAVTGIIEESPAAEAGFQKGDIILSMNGEATNDVTALTRMIGSQESGSTASFGIIREGQEQTLSVALGKREKFCAPEDCHKKVMRMHHGHKPGPMLGVMLEHGEDVQGIVIEEVIEGSAAAAMGLQEGDVITSFNGQKVGTPKELIDLIRAAGTEDEVRVGYKRDGKKATANGVLKAGHPGRHMHGPHFDMDFDFDHMRDMDIDIDIDEFSEGTIKEMIHNALEGLDLTDEQLAEVHERLQKELSNIEVDVDISEGATHKRIMIKIEVDEPSDEELEKLAASNPDIDFSKGLDITDLSLSPNPNQGRFELNFQLPEVGRTWIRVFDQNGSKVQEQYLGQFTGSYTGEIDISEHAEGLYFVNIQQEGRSKSTKVIVQ